MTPRVGSPPPKGSPRPDAAYCKSPPMTRRNFQPVPGRRFPLRVSVEWSDLS